MKSKTIKVKQYSMLALDATAVIPMSCGTKEEADDPNITARALSLSVTPDVVNSNKTVLFDIDANGTNDFYLAGFYTNYGTEKKGSFISNAVAGNQMISNTVSSLPMITPIAANTEISAASTTWIGGAYGAFINNTPLSLGVNDAGDKYAAVRFKIGANLHYGWLKFNVTNASKTITLKEGAFDTRPDTPIKAGAK